MQASTPEEPAAEHRNETGDAPPPAGVTKKAVQQAQFTAVRTAGPRLGAFSEEREWAYKT
jgi:hypothetical protein